MNLYKLRCEHLASSEQNLHPGRVLDCPVCHLPMVIEDLLNTTTVPQVTAILGPDGRDSGETTLVPISSVTNGVSHDRSYGCSWGCGNPYDYVFVSVADGTTEFLCLPCFLKLAQEIVTAVISPDGEAVMAAVADMRGVEQAPMRAGGPRKRGKNAPANTDDPDLLEAFDSRVMPDELGDEFK